MRFVSEQFKEIQDEIIRPALSKLTFEINTDVANVVLPVGYNIMDYDDTVAPIVTPKNCLNKHYYAVVGDESTVDDPLRICAPDNSGVMSTPNHLVPWGVTPYLNAHQRVIIGSSTDAFNFKGIMSPIEFSFIGGHLPTRLDVEVIDPNTGWWVSAFIYEDLNGIRTVTYTPDSYDAERLYRFEVHARTAGRFQVSYIMAKKSAVNGLAPVKFERNHIAKVDINNDTDLTSQSLPSYEMTVECLDVNAEYTPDTDYWDKQFKDGTPCYLNAAYEINGVNEYVNLMFGKLTEKPNYEQGKITFKVSVDWRKDWTFNINPYFSDALAVGDEVPSDEFYLIMLNGKLFDSYDVFANGSDLSNSVCNYSGEIDSKEARQLVANALGCFMKANFNKIELINANSIQYRGYDDLLTRYGQVKYSLESKPKVGRISVERSKNTVLGEYIEATASASAVVGTDSSRYVTFWYELPFFATGKFEIVDAQSDNPDAVVHLFSNPDVIKLDNGNFLVGMPFTATEIATIQPIVRFYKVQSDTFEETENLVSEVEGDVYSNSNVLITNSYVANKVKQVAHLVSDISNTYEVDVVQDLRYEVGDIIRLETEKNTYVTCVITSVRFNLPGSSGHITCRKVFAFEDSDKAILDPVGLSVSFGLTEITVTKQSERACFVGIMHTATDTYIYVMGVEEYDEDISGTVTSETYNGKLTDFNGHEWKFACYSVPSGTPITTGATAIDLPEYDISTGVTPNAFGAISLLKAVYSEQGMTAPVDWSCTWEEY